MEQNPQQIYQQTQLLAPIDQNNSYFVIDMLDPVSKKYLTYRVTSAQLGALLQSMSKTCCTYTVKTTLSSSQIKNLFTTPIVLVPPAGSGLIVEPLSNIFEFTFGTVAYDTHVGLVIASNGNTSLFYNSFTLDKGSNTIQVGLGGTSYATSVLADITNQSIVAYVQIGNPTTGDGTLTIYTTFKVITA